MLAAFCAGSPALAGERAGVPFCARNVEENAKKLFLLHGSGDGVGGEEPPFSLAKVKELPSMKSPDGKRRYKVYETHVLVGKGGDFRIRMIYAQLGETEFKNDCVLMGQEILDMSRL
jgi:hypothetical protein